jgi:hypothetical protein
MKKLHAAEDENAGLPLQQRRKGSGTIPFSIR